MHHPLLMLLVRLHLALLGGAARARRRDERGDVPGWVMVTVMSATVIAVLTPLLRNELSSMLRNALDSVR